ncbi:carboxymuconolactone decarboxylase family protein [Kitasatospora kifunensis]|uniref:4-carboxymuconolactone decarboxylase n=1 Tax=Kitasatospora kifunensis TaxID=58351 RepID=A0A7W7VSL3_KITKI|nr:carboxymuconolactone decarboxylase family protein [Kitasatospora kifunensis]MBB4921301.1 4-carboxymuconolactone decarboxylase [Kitasatospora kifunensis]
MSETPDTAATTSTSTRYDRGLALLQEVSGDPVPAVLSSLADIAPDLARYTIEFGYGDIYHRPGLSLRQRQLINIAALTALGTAAPQLRFHINGALNVGVTPREIVETIIHMLVYAGVPAALNGMTVAREVFAERPSPEQTPLGDLARSQVRPAQTSEDRYRRGLAALKEIDGHAGEQVVAALQDIAPDLGRYIIEFSFGDIYSRTGLTLKERELASVAACTALGTAAPQLRVHIHGLLNVGGSREEVVETITHLTGYAGFPAALNGITAAREVFAQRDADPQTAGR